MNKILANDALLLIFRVLVGALFVYSAIEKISRPEEFAVSLLNYRILPEFAINIIAIILPWIELITGVLLLIGVETNNSSAIILTMLSVFTVAVLIAIIRGLNIDCGCFGTLMAEKVGFRKISENMFFILLCLALIIKGGGIYTICYFNKSGK